MKVYCKDIESRKYLILENIAAIPMDRIKYIDFKAPNGGAENSVRIHTDDDSEDWTFAYHNADVIRNFFIGV